jgi:hypothetical protein
VDRALLEQNLALAEKHLVQARAHVEQQRRIVDALERDGHNSELARKILATFKQLLELQIEDRERLITLLSKRLR